MIPTGPGKQGNVRLTGNCSSSPRVHRRDWTGSEGGGWGAGGGEGLPRGGSRQRAPRVHQHTPAVASGLVALHRLVEPPGGALGDDNALPGILPGLFQGALPLLVTRMDFVCKRRGSLW